MKATVTFRPFFYDWLDPRKISFSFWSRSCSPLPLSFPSFSFSLLINSHLLSSSRSSRLDLRGARVSAREGKRRSLSTIRNVRVYSYLKMEEGERGKGDLVLQTGRRGDLNGRFRIMQGGRTITYARRVSFSSRLFHDPRSLLYLFFLLFLIPPDRERNRLNSVTSVRRYSSGRNIPRVSKPKVRRDTFGGVCTRYYSW